MEYSTQPAPPKKFGLSASQGSGLRQEAKQSEAAQMLKKKSRRSNCS
ncbi:MAG: hypothetical protein NTZ55_04860 [Candidatus Roizmanbacteria bacterium]|nr:hypothetical protein [Candidatus Roizmanbacteria bacterium]